MAKKWMRFREMYRLELLQARESGGSNTSADVCDDGDDGHEPSAVDGKKRSCRRAKLRVHGRAKVSSKIRA